MVVTVAVCAVFGLTVSEAKTSIMCLRTKGMREATAIFSVEATDLAYKQRTGSFTSGGMLTTTPQCRPLSIKVDRRIRNAWGSFWTYTLELID